MRLKANTEHGHSFKLDVFLTGQAEYIDQDLVKVEVCPNGTQTYFWVSPDDLLGQLSSSPVELAYLERELHKIKRGGNAW